MTVGVGKPAQVDPPALGIGSGLEPAEHAAGDLIIAGQQLTPGSTTEVTT